MTALILIPDAIARVRREARAAVTDLSLRPSRWGVAWMVMRGARNPKARRQQENHGAPAPQPGWHRLAEVIMPQHPRAGDDGPEAA